MFKSHASKNFLICSASTLIVLAIYVFNGFDVLESKAVDFRFHLRGARPVDENIVVIMVDEPSIEKLGRWPWPRRVHGELVEKLAKAGAKVVAFDSLFTEKDLGNPASDSKLAEAAQETGIVVSAFLFRGDLDQKIFGLDPLFPYEPLFQESFLGFVNLEPDKDGVSRHAYLYAIDGERVYPSFAVATLALSQTKSIDDIFPDLPLVVNKDPNLAENELFINYAHGIGAGTGGGYPYPTYSYADILGRSNELETIFKDKIVLVGATAAGLFDLKATPFLSKYPGVMIHANVIDNLLHQIYMREIPSYITALIVFIIGLGLALLLPKLSTWTKLTVFLALIGSFMAVAQWLFAHRNLVIHVVPLLVLVLVSYGGVIFYQLVVEEREKRKIKVSFKQYLSPKIVDVITRDPSKLKLGGEEREVTVFFLDIAGFTTMSEALKPTQLVEVMNQCLTEFSGIIFKHDGLINKYIGDCIMAFWNAPADQSKHAALACYAALDCIKALPNLNRKFQEKGLPSIDCRVGINTGVVVVGNMGSQERFDYTVMGDPVNLASRLEGANKQYHSHIMISEVTFEQAKEDIEARDLDLIRVKGKKEPRKVFEVLCRKGEMTEELSQGRKIYHDALALYRKQNFEEAIHMFDQVFSYLPNDHATRIYLERARAFVNNPPPAFWDGVFEMKTK